MPNWGGDRTNMRFRTREPVINIAQSSKIFLLNQCPPSHNTRASEMAAGLVSLGFLAKPMICERVAF
jgi:hypothetical protein